MQAQRMLVLAMSISVGLAHSACDSGSLDGPGDAGASAARDGGTVSGRDGSAAADVDAGAARDEDSGAGGGVGNDSGAPPSDAGPPVARTGIPSYVPTPSCGASSPPHVYYVDYVTGADTNDGSMARPWQHAPGDPGGPMRSLVAGDVVQFRGGVVYGGHVVFETSGAEGACVVYRGTGWGPGRAIFDGGGAGSYAFVWKRSAPDFIRIEGFEIRDIRVGSHAAIELAYTGIEHVQIVDNVIHEISGERPDFQGKAIYITAAVDVLVEGNTFYDTDFTSLVATGGRDLRVRGNDISAPRSNASMEVALDGCDGFIGDVKGTLLFEANHIHHLLSPCHSDGLQILGFEDLMIRRNVFGEAGNNAIRIEPYSDPHGGNPAGDVVIENNLIYSADRSTAQGISISHWANDVRSARIVHNTIVNQDFGAGCFGHGDRFSSMGYHHAIGSLELVNNVCFNGIVSYHPDVVSGVLHSDYNAYFNDARTWVLNLKSLERFRADPANAGYDTHSISLSAAEAASAFVDAARGDFHLAAGSRLVDMGSPLTATTQDLDGAGRPVGGGYDLGAYERR